MVDLLKHQRRFVGRAFAKGIDTAALSLARGEGKSELAAWILERCLTPGHAWNVPGSEYLLGRRHRWTKRGTCSGHCVRRSSQQANTDSSIALPGSA